jgi:hypothetical protein
MIDTYPLHPELTEQGKEEAQQIMDSFKPKLVKLLDEVLGDLYTDISYYVESDHWTNYRNAIMNGLKDYKHSKRDNKYDYKEIRKVIYRENRDEIIKDLDQDNVTKIAELERQIEFMDNRRY